MWNFQYVLLTVIFQIAVNPHSVKDIVSMSNNILHCTTPQGLHFLCHGSPAWAANINTNRLMSNLLF